MIWWPYFTSWSKRSLSRFRLMNHILCKWQLLRHYFEWVWVALGEWDIILGMWGWVGVYGALLLVGGGGWGWVGAGALFIMSNFLNLVNKNQWVWALLSLFILWGRRERLEQCQSSREFFSHKPLDSAWIN